MVGMLAQFSHPCCVFPTHPSPTEYVTFFVFPFSAWRNPLFGAERQKSRGGPRGPSPLALTTGHVVDVVPKAHLEGVFFPSTAVDVHLHSQI